MAAIIAIVLFLLAAFGKTHFGDVNVVALGLAFLALAVLIGPWPIGVIVARRS